VAGSACARPLSACRCFGVSSSSAMFLTLLMLIAVQV